MARDAAQQASLAASAATAERPPPRKPSLRKKLAFLFIMLVVGLCLIELVIRAGAFIAGGFNPHPLVYGFVPAANPNSGFNHDGYFTYPPNHTMHQLDKQGRTIAVHFNSDGF